MGPGPGLCPTCAVDHPTEDPHNAQSVFYQYRFRANRGRWPTWKDAIAHCTREVREEWERILRQVGEWTEPESEVPDVLPTPRRTIGTITEMDIDPTTENESTWNDV